MMTVSTSKVLKRPMWFWSAFPDLQDADFDLSRQPRHPHRECAAGAGHPSAHQLEHLIKPLVVSLHATPERLIQVRQNRLLSMGAGSGNDDYIDRQSVTDEVTFARRLSAKFNWALLDVTRRSIEETAAAIMKLLADRQRQRPLD